MTQFVLIPGAWLGAWAWTPVVKLLEKHGHSAHAVTLTGMGDRAHLVSPELGMPSAVQDVLNLIRYAELDDLVIVGHSFAGKVAAVVADRLAPQVRKVIYVDAFRPERVTTAQGGFDPTREFGPVPPGALGVPLSEEIVERIGPDVKGAALRRMMTLATPWPLRMAKDPIELSSAYSSIHEAYILCRRSGDPVDEIVAGKWGKLEGPHRILDTGHWPMITDPEGTARDLIALEGHS